MMDEREYVGLYIAGESEPVGIIRKDYRVKVIDPGIFPGTQWTRELTPEQKQQIGRDLMNSQRGIEEVSGNYNIRLRPHTGAPIIIREND